MPLHGKIVVIKRSGGDGTEFPITASCLFGRKPDCDIRIQLPQVSKEHCRIDLNENKEVMLTNLSLVNPTRINGAAMEQAQHLRHGDVITIIDRSFRFEYPPEPTPKKKRPSLAGKSEKLPVGDSGTSAIGERRKSGVITDSSCLKDGTNTNVQALAIENCEDAAKEVDQTGLEQKTPSEKESRSPFCELYQIVKQNLSMKSPWKPAQPQTPHSRCEPKKVLEVKTTVGEMGQEASAPQNGQSTPLPKKPVKQKRRSSVGCVAPTESNQAESSSGGEVTPKSTKRRSKVSSEPSMVTPTPAEGQVGQDSSQLVVTPSKVTPKKSRLPLETSAEQSVPEEKGTPTSQKKHPQGTPQKFSANEVVRQIVAEDSAAVENADNSKTPKGRRSMGSDVLYQNSPGAPSMSIFSASHDISSVTQVQCECEAEMPEAKRSPKVKESASPRRVSPRKSPGKKLQASDVLRQLELTAPPSGRKSAKAGTPTSTGKKRKSEKLESDLPGPQLKRKRVSFGGQLSPELFDKRLPPNSPLRKGATPGRRSLSVLRQSLLRGCTAGLIEELRADLSSPKSKTPPRSPNKKASPKTPSPKNGGSSPKSPKTKAKTPSPKRVEVKSSPGQKPAAKASSNSKQSPATEDPVVPKGRNSIGPIAKTPQTPSSGKTSVKQLNESLQKSPVTSKRTPSQPVLADAGSPSVTNACRRKSVSDVMKMSPGQSTAEMPQTPLLADKASDSTAKTPSPKGMSFNECSFNQTPSVKGRFSISRISTPSPVSDQDAGAMETSACTTPSLPVRRKSIKSTPKRTPKSARKSVLEVVRSRRSGASRANLKVVRSYAEIVKLGVSKPQTATTTKKCTRKVVAVKKTVVKKLKTPARKVKDHFSTGHAASPATIVVGKTHTKVAQTAGFAPKIVHNIALLKKNMKVDEDLSGIAEIFRTPATVLKRKPTSDSICPETPQAASPSFTESSLLNTPEEMGEMIVSPLSVISPKKHGVYDSEAIEWLLQEDQDSSLNGNDAPQGSGALITPSCPDKPEQVHVLKRGQGTPKQKSEPLACLTGVKRLMKTPKQKVQQVEDLRGIKRLLKTPRGPKVPQEESLSGVKEIMKTPKLKNVPLVCTTGVKRLMKTPKQKGEPVEDMIGVKQLMQTPKQKEEPREHLTGVKQLMTTPSIMGEPVDDMIVVKQLMQTPEQKDEPTEHLTGVKRLMKTPKQKGEPVEDMIGVKRLMQTPSLQTPKQKEEPREHLTGVKRLMKTPKLKGEPIEDMIGVKRLMQTPKQKVEQVEDLTGVKELMRTPKQKGQPVESNFGIRKLMKSPRQRGVPVEDFAGLQELMEEPLDYLPSEAAFKVCETSEEVSGACASPGLENVPAADEADLASKEESTELMLEEYQSNATKTSVRGRRQKQVVKISSPDTKYSGQANTQSGAEIDSAGDVDRNMPEVKPKRGRQARQVAAPVVKRTRQKISEIKEPINSAVAVTKCTRRRGAKHVDESEKSPIEENLSANVESAEDDDKLKSSGTEIKEIPAVSLLPTNARGRKKTKEIPQNDPAAAPVRKTARGRKANLADEVVGSKVECSKVSPAPKVEDGSEKLPATVPVVEPRRGRKSKKADAEEHATVAQNTEGIISDSEQSAIGSCLPESKDKAPVIKSGRGRRAKAVVKEDEDPIEVLPKRSRRGAVDSLALQTVASPAPSSKSGCGRGRKAKNLDTTEEIIPVQAAISSTEHSAKSPKKVRGMRRQAKISDTVALDSASVSLEAVSHNAGVPEADKDTEVEANIKTAKRVSAKKSVRWNSDLMSNTTETGLLANSEEGSPQSLLVIGEESAAELAENGSSLVEEAKVNLERQTGPRRGRAGKKSAVPPTESAPVSENLGAKPEKALPKRKGRALAEPKSDSLKDVPIAKGGTKRKLMHEGSEEVTLNGSASESVSIDPLPKRARGRPAKVEGANTEEASKNVKGALKRMGKALDNEVEDTKPIVITPKPARRGRRNMAQPDAAESVPAQECPAKKPVTRGRPKTEKKADCTKSEEVRPVRRTRQK